MNGNRPHWADTAIAIFTGLMLVTYITANYFSCQQLKLTQATLNEVRKGGSDSHDLAIAAKAQADSAAAQAGSMKNLAERTLAQATSMKNLAAASKGQLDAILESNKISREALTSVQRAFITHTLRATPAIDSEHKKITAWQIQSEWENSGTTPTRNAVQRLSFQELNREIPKDFAFPDFGEVRTTPFVIGPKGTMLSAAQSIEAAMIARARSIPKQWHLYAWGWVGYRDMFAGTTVHVTEFCVEFLPGNDALNINAPALNRRLCDSHNCTDRDCKDYDRIAAQVKP